MPSAHPCLVSRLLVAAALLAATGGPLAACAGPDPTFADGGTDYAMLSDGAFCLPDNDGRIDNDELVFRAGMAANYRVNPKGTVARLDPNGKLVLGKVEWDFSSLDGQVARLAVDSVKGTWFEKYFPTADIAMLATAHDDTLQVLDVQEGGVALLGLASRKPDHTLVVYEAPVLAMKFPLHKGQSFTSTGTTKAGAKISGLPVHTEDTYEVAIRTEGVLRLPYLRLHRTLLIETLVTSKTVGGVVNTTRQLQWFSECYGEAVRALSKTGEKSALFSEAVELRKLSL